jgi:hypothetical protein
MLVILVLWVWFRKASSLILSIRREPLSGTQEMISLLTLASRAYNGALSMILRGIGLRLIH